MSHLINTFGMDRLTHSPVVASATATFDFCDKTITIVADGICLLAPTLGHFAGGGKLIPQVEQHVRPKRDAIVIDVGANIGAISIWHALAFPMTTIHSVEPSSHNFGYLVENTKPFDNIYLHKWAAHDEVGEVDIALPTDEQRPVVPNTAQISIYGKSGKYKERVRALPLDAVFDYADLIKIDAEGHTIPILEGAKELIERHSPILQVEGSMDSYKMAGITLDDLISYMSDIGYTKAGYVYQDAIFRRNL